MIIDIQKGFLSSILYSESLSEAISCGLYSELFTYPLYKNIFKKMEFLHEKSIVISPISLVNELDSSYETVLMDIYSSNSISISSHFINILEENYQKELIKKEIFGLIDGFENKKTSEIKSTLYSFVSNLEDKTQDKLFEVHSFDESLIKPIKCIGNDYIKLPLGVVSMLAAKGGIGKSATAINCAITEALHNNKSFLWLSEDPLGESMNRINLISQNYSFSDIKETIKQNILISDDIPFYIVDKNGEPTSDFYRFKQIVKDCKLIVLDTLINFYIGAENDNVDARKFMKPLMKWAKDENKAILLLHHTDKYKDYARGAGDIVNACKSVYYLKENKFNKSARDIELKKDNYNIGIGNFTVNVFPTIEKHTSTIKKEKNYSVKELIKEINF